MPSGFSFNTLFNTIKNPLHPPDPRDPFNKNVGMAQTPEQKAAAGDTGAPPADRNLGNELNTILQYYPQFGQAYYDNQARYSGALTGLNTANMQNAFKGQFDPTAFNSANPGFDQYMRDAKANGDMAGWTPQQMAAAYSGTNAEDPSLNQYYTGGLGSIARTAYEQANPGLTAYTQGLGGDMARINGMAPGRVDPSGYFATGSENQSVGPASQSGSFSAQSYGGIPQTYGGGGYDQIAGPTRARDVNAIGVSAPSGYDRVNAQTGFNAINPQTGFNSVNAQSSDIGLMNAANRLTQSGPSALQQQITNQASGDLALGGALSAEDRRNAQQAAREGWSARGLINSNGAVASEVLNRQSLSDQRSRERMATAQGVENTNFAQGQQGYANALGLSNAAQGYAGLNLQGQQANLGAQLQGNQLNFQGQNANLQGQLAGNQLGLQGQIANQGARQANNALGQQGQIANQNAYLSAQQANQGADLALNNQRYQVGAANQSAGLQNNQLGLGYSQLNNSAYQDAQARMQQGSQFNATLGSQNSQFNAAQQNAMTQFGANLGQQNNQFNANATNQAAQFNSTASNDLGMYNAALQQQNANDQWNRSMQYGQFQQQQAINPLAYYSTVNGNPPDYTNQLMNYGGDLYNTNFNAQASQYNSAQNNAAASNSAMMGAGATVGAAALMAF